MTKDTYRYDYLNSIHYTIHETHRPLIKKEVLEEMDRYSDFEMYDRKRILHLSENNLIQDELNKLIKDLLEYRQQHPEESNQEAMCMNQITELLSKLDVEDFRKIHIEALLTVPPEKTEEEKARDKQRREEVRKEYKKLYPNGLGTYLEEE